MNDAVGGQVDAITDNLPSVIGHIKASRLRPLAVMAEKRSPTLPDVPTYAELGFPQMGGGGWFGVVVPTGTAPAIVMGLNQAIHKPHTHGPLIARVTARRCRQAEVMRCVQCSSQRQRAPSTSLRTGVTRTPKD